jgi:hypothetical protein
MPTGDLYSGDQLAAEAQRLAADYRCAAGNTLQLSGQTTVNDVIGLFGSAQIKDRSTFNEGRSRRLVVGLDWSNNGMKHCEH